MPARTRGVDRATEGARVVAFEVGARNVDCDVGARVTGCEDDVRAVAIGGRVVYVVGGRRTDDAREFGAVVGRTAGVVRCAT